MRKTLKKPMKFAQTVDTFIDSIQWSDNRAVLVHRREHGGRTYVRFRTWNRHKTKNVWYPSKRSFVVPVGNAEPLADALRAGADGVEGSKPGWFVVWERKRVSEQGRQYQRPEAIRFRWFGFIGLRQFRPPLGGVRIMALARIGDIPGFVVGDETMDAIQRTLVFRA